MDSVDLEVLKTAIKWMSGGHRVTLGTIVRTWGSAPRPVGAMMVIRGDGQVIGSVSGGCVEDDLIARVQQGELAGSKPEKVTYGVSAEEAARFGLPCGGTLQIVLEPIGSESQLDALLAIVETHGIARRSVNLETGVVFVAQGSHADALEFDGSTLTTVHGPRYRLLLIGAGQVSRYVAMMAQALDYHVIVCDPREEYAAEWYLPGVEFTRGMPDDVVKAMNPDGHSAVVALTHDPKLDDLALMEALKSGAFYVGALGSRANNDKRRQRLREFDLGEAEVARLHGPVGLKLGGKTPPEIAISILAEMTAIKRGAPLPAAAPQPAPSGGCGTT
ncbi:MAG: XdhC family protein [Burkholderiales bacterium]|nr:MAG: XdhC family protein [Burkholderiales bacterium]